MPKRGGVIGVSRDAAGHLFIDRDGDLFRHILGRGPGMSGSSVRMSITNALMGVTTGAAGPFALAENWTLPAAKYSFLRIYF